ncbi:MAG TPA: cytochrome d ubiquinol oxidase subunit II [Polyangiaceae bacterium]|jgi:cytochrome d ubiquinol oxidase subunit II|nr:cytochrome d ubiquinol oxidase subunit II [Polyangiaceae bacterium]
MAELWFSALSLMLTGFVIFGGADCGVGALSLSLAKTDAERRAAVAAIGPFWHGNEVWLIASGGVLFLAFPTLLATAFPAFYLALFLVLWCLVLRGIALEVRSHVHDLLWRAFWDVVFCGSSGLLALLFGVALGNVVRGVPVGPDRRFTLAFFTNFVPAGEVGLLDYYTVSVGLLALVALLAHGAAFLAFRCDGALRSRARHAERRLWVAGAVLFGVVSVETFTIRPELFAALAARPLAWLFTLVAVAGAVLGARAHRREQDGLVFVGGALLLGGLLGATAVGLYPTLLYSTLEPRASLTAPGTLSAPYGLTVALAWWPVALGLAITYFTFMFKKHAGKLPSDSAN